MSDEYEELKKQTKSGMKKYPSGTVNKYSSNQSDTREKARKDLYELADESDDKLTKVATHFEELATAAKYPDEEQQHTRDLLYQLVEEVDSAELADSILQAHKVDLTSETNRERTTELAKQYEELLSSATAAIKSATKAGRKTYKSGNTRSYKSSKGATREAARERLVELVKETEGEIVTEIATHLEELATAAKYPDEEQQHTRDLLYQLVEEVDSAELAESILQAHKVELGSETNRERTTELAKQYEELLSSATAAFKSATKAGRKTYKSGNTRSYKSSKGATREAAREVLVELAEESEGEIVTEIATHLEELATAAKYPDEEQNHSIKCLFLVDNHSETQFLNPILEDPTHDLYARVIEILPKLDDSVTNPESVASYVEGLGQMVTNHDLDSKDRTTAVNSLSKVVAESPTSAAYLEEYAPEVAGIISDSELNSGLRVNAAKLLTAIVKGGVTEPLDTYISDYLTILFDPEEPTELRTAVAETLREFSSQGGQLSDHVESLDQFVAAIIDSNEDMEFRAKLAELLAVFPRGRIHDALKPELLEITHLMVDRDTREELRTAVTTLLKQSASSNPVDFFAENTSKESPINVLTRMHETPAAMESSGAVFGRLLEPTFDGSILEDVDPIVEVLDSGSEEKYRALIWLEAVATEPWGAMLLTQYIDSITPLAGPAQDVEIKVLVAKILANLEEERPGILKTRTKYLWNLLNLDVSENQQAVESAANALSSLAATDREAVKDYTDRFAELPETNSLSTSGRVECANALAEIADKFPGTVVAHTELLYELLADDNRRIRRLAAKAIASLAGTNHVDKIADQLESTSFRDRSAFDRSLLGALHDIDALTRLEAIEAIGFIADHDVNVVRPYLGDLVYYLHSEDKAVDDSIVIALSQFAHHSPTSLESHVETLSPLPSETDPEIMATVAYILGEIAGENPDAIEGCTGQLQDNLDHVDAGVRINAAWALSVAGVDDETAEIITKRLAQESYLNCEDAELRQRAVETLEQCEAYDALPDLREQLQREEDEGVITTLEGGIEQLEDLARDIATNHASTADEHKSDAKAQDSEASKSDDNPDAFESAINEYQIAREAYERAIEVLTVAGLEAEAIQYERQLEIIEYLVSSCQLGTVQARLEQIKTTVYKTSTEEKEALEDLLDDIAEVRKNYENDANESKLKSVENEIRYRLWEAWITPLKTDIASLENESPPNALEAIRDIQKQIDEYEPLPIQYPEDCLQLETIYEKLGTIHGHFVARDANKARTEIATLVDQLSTPSEISAGTVTTREYALPQHAAIDAEVTLTDWYVSTGDRVTEDSVVADLRTADTTIGVAVPHNGTIDGLAIEEETEISTGATLLTVTVNSGARKTGPSITTAKHDQESDLMLSEPITEPEGSLECSYCGFAPDSKGDPHGNLCGECESGYITVSGDPFDLEQF